MGREKWRKHEVTKGGKILRERWGNYYDRKIQMYQSYVHYSLYDESCDGMTCMVCHSACV